MRVYLGSDHAGFELKAHLVAHLASLGHEAIDVGPAHYDADDDYPAFCIEAARRVLADPGSLGIVIGGSGNGEQIAANKVPGVRAGAGLERRDRPAGPPAQRRQGGRASAPGCTRPDEAAEIAAAFVATPFSGDERHQRRIDILTEYQRTGEPPALPPDQIP